MKTGILTFHGADNYGSVLQAYALAAYLNTMGIEAETIDYNFAYDYRQYKLFRTYKYKSNPKSFISDCISFISHMKRRCNFNAFRRAHLKLSDSTVSTMQQLSELNNHYDCFICGSDQIWNLDCTNGVNDAYFLRFAADEKLKIAYAPSMGSYALKEADVPLLYESLCKLDAISVREPSMLETLRRIDSNLSVQTVLDPTMLLTAEDYKKELMDKQLLPEQRYIFVYVLGGSKAYADILNYARTIADDIGCEVRYIIDNNNGMQRLHGKNCSGCNPCEFLSLICNAVYVLTNSFHATVFSILFHKDFTAFGRGASTGRITDLLDLFGLRNCYWNPDKKQLNHIADYDSVDLLLAQKRKDAADFLQKAFNKDEEKV